MNKKASAKVKRASAKLKKTKALHKNKTSKPQMAVQTQRSSSFIEDPRFTQAVQNYETGEKAIKLNPSNRYHARNESDFQNMSDDPRFTELLYPEELEASASPAPASSPAAVKNKRR